MSLVLNILYSSDKKQNEDLLDYLYKVAMYKGDCDSYGAVLATILAAFDLNYHSKYINENNVKRNNPLSHLDRMNLQQKSFLKDLIN